MLRKDYVDQMRIYAGNLAYATDQDSLRRAFEEYGEVSDAFVVMDRDTGRSKGFGFVDMPNDSEAQSAIQSLDGADLDGRQIRVNEALPQGNR